MSKIKSVEEYRDKLHEQQKRGNPQSHEASEKDKRLEGETSDYAQRLHDNETKGRPKPGRK